MSYAVVEDVAASWERYARYADAFSEPPSGLMFGATSKGSSKRGKIYFLGGTTSKAVQSKASVGTQVSKLPAGEAGRKPTLSGWLGNYNKTTAQVRAEFAGAAGTVLARLRIGPDSTIGSADMARRSRTAVVPRGTTQVTLVITFTSNNHYNLAGAGDLSLVLS